jgi:hypothetical protein
MKHPTPDWERRMAALWTAIDDYADPGPFRAAVDAIAAELPAGDPTADFERASARDSIGETDDAEPLYRAALASGLSGYRRRRATIQLASSVRALGRPEESVAMLTSERETAAGDELSDALTCVLALALADLGRDREGLALVLEALAAHLPRYNRSMAAYARELVEAG